jgi:hypothetical protein
MADISSSLAAYDEVEANFKQQKAAELFLQKLMASDPDSAVKFVGASSAEREAADKLWSELRKEVDTCRKVADRLDKGTLSMLFMSIICDSVLLNAENDRVTNRVKDFDMNTVTMKYGSVNYAERVQAMEEELQRVRQEQQVMATLIAQRTARQQQLASELKDAQLDSEEIIKKTENHDPVLLAEIVRLKALIGGIEALTNIHVNSMKYNGTNMALYALRLHNAPYISSRA